MSKPFSFHPGRNCWRLSKADRIGFLIDGEAYFSTLADVLEKAEQTVYIVGWDIDSRIRLRRDTEDDKGETLREALNRIAGKKEQLEIYLLDWDFAMLYALEREPLPMIKLGWRTHDKVHLHMDARHPVGASHHQKMVVVDDCIAFVGGLDLARCRWDTSDHAPQEARRSDNGASYPPFHDVQMMVDGAAATALGELARRRWHRATGSELDPPQRHCGDLWPSGRTPALENVRVAIMRTEPQFDDGGTIEEIKTFYLEAIAAARHSIYIENQYLTSHAVGAALEARLQENDGPDVVLVLPRTCSGWLEENTMGALRSRLIGKLRQADRHQRLGIYYPTRANLGEEVINVHSKVLVVDDDLVRIGSSNLNNRSMGFDTECDLALAAEDEETRQGISSFRSRLLAEHLGCSEDEVAAQVRKSGSLKEAVDALRGKERTLEDLPESNGGWVTDILSETDIVDPEKPVGLDRLLNILNVNDNQTGAAVFDSPGKKSLVLAALVLIALGLAAAWRWTPLAGWLDRDTLIPAAEALRGSPWAIPGVLAVFLVGSLIMVPVTVLIVATAVAFGPVTGFFLALGGSLLGGLASFGLGCKLGRQAVRGLAGERVNALSRRLSRRGWLAVALIRLVPIAPFTIVNLVAGASHISLRDFLLGTLAGMAPGILAIILVEGSLEQILRRPAPSSWLLAAALLVVAGLIFWGARHWSQKQEKRELD